MRGAPGTGVPWVFLSCLCCCLLLPEALGTSTIATASRSPSSPGGAAGGGNTSPPSSVSGAPPTPSEVLSRVSPAGSTAGSSGDTSPPGTGSLRPVTSGASVTATPAGLSTAPPSNTSTQDTSVLPQDRSTPSMETARESQTSSLTGVSASVPPSSPKGNALTETASQEASSPPEATTSSASRVSGTHPRTSAVVTRTASTDSAPGSTGDASLPGTGSLRPVTSGASVTATPAGLSTAVSSSSSAQDTASPSPDQLTQHPETSVEHTTKSAGTTTTSSSSARGTSSPGSSPPDTPTSSPSFSPPFADSHTTQPTTEVSSAATSRDTTLTMRAKSVFVPSTFSPTVSDVSSTGRPTDLPAPTSLITSSREASATSRMAQTQSSGTTTGSETASLVSVGIETVSAATPPAATSTSSGHVSLLTHVRTVAPSGPSTTSVSTPVSDSHGTPSRAPTLLSLATDGPLVVSPTMESGVASHTPSSVWSTSGEALTASPSSAARESQTAGVSPSEGSDEDTLPNATHIPTSSRGISSTPTQEHPRTPQTTPSATSAGTRPVYVGPTSSRDGPGGATLTLSSSPTNYSLSKTRPETSFPSKHPTLQPSTDLSSSGSTSSANVGTDQTTPGFSTSISNSSLPQPAPAPAGSSTRSTTTFLPGHPTALSVASPSSPPAPSAGSTEEPETSGLTATRPSTVTSPFPTTSQTPATSSPRPPPPGPVKPEQGISLFSYGPSAGDQQFVSNTVDFTSRLFRIQIGFPLGSSLWDSVYFTDNGQIFFPESDYQIFPYPNPPPGGFTGRDTIATVAPFWDDADFSSRKGTIFYQEYETLYNKHDQLVQEVETWIEKFTNSWGYKAKWTLKVTWVNVSAYPAQRTTGTNTYQAILSTDGSRSYALFLYQSGGMQWDVTQHRDNPVLMGFSSGDGYFKNSPLMSRPLWEKYRPEQFLDPKLGVRGLQIYRLHREERPNFRLGCLQRLSSQQPSWTPRPIFCPCSWQQGRWDLRFQPISIGRWGSRSRHLCSFSSWRGSVCCSYGPWGEFQEGWSVQRPGLLDWELETQNWCCRWNDKPYFCALYHERQPRVGCAAYRPPRPAWMFGDPHITTLDGTSFTFSGLGDFLLVHAWNSNSSFMLQGRTTQTGSANATNFIAFAAQYKAGDLGPITVQFLLGPNDTVHVLHDDRNVTFETSQEDGEETFNATGVLLTRNGSLVSASLDGTVTISVTALSSILHASSSLPAEYRDHTEGLLGVWNDNPEDDFRMPNGSSVPHNSSEETLFHYGMTWALNGTSLLGPRSDPLPSNFSPVFFSQLSANTSLASGCDGDRWCIYDTLATGNTFTGLHTRDLFRTYQMRNATLNQFPPSINGCLVMEAYKDQTTQVQCTSNSENVTFVLQGNQTSFQLSENGTLQWTPKSLEPVTLEILARDAWTGLSSVLQPKTVTCFCRTIRQCLYNQTRRVGNSSLEEAGCQCDGDTFGHRCERFKDPCDERCFPNVQCTPGRGCGACPLNMTGDGRHCAALEDPLLCQNKSCPTNYCYNHGHCYVSHGWGCQPTCTCPPAFTDARCFLAGNSFVPSVLGELPVRSIQLSLREEENATKEDVNASVAYRLECLDVQAFLQNSRVELSSSAALASGRSIQHWKVVSEFGYRPGGPVIHFLNQQLLDAVVRAFLPQAWGTRWKRSVEARNNVIFLPISREDVFDGQARLNTSNLSMYFKCNSYEGYRLVYDPQNGVTCVSPCSEGYCHHGGQCQHWPDGPRCSCVSFSIYVSWGERCEHLSMKLGAFFGILFGSLGALLALGAVAWVALRLWDPSKNECSYPLPSEH